MTGLAIAAPGASSIVARKRRAPGASSIVARLDSIERCRRARDISHAELCRRAGVDEKGWRAIRAGRRHAKPATLARLEAALDGGQRAKPASVIAAFHRLVTIEIAKARRLKPAEVLATDFSVQRPNNPAWLAAAHVNRIALYITAVELEVENVTLGAALGCSRQNVQQARNAVEDMREHAATDRMIARVTALVTGRAQ